MRIGKIMMLNGLLCMAPWAQDGVRVIDDFEVDAVGWEDALLAEGKVVKSIGLSSEQAKSKSGSLKVVLDSLDGTPTPEGTYPRQTGIQTLKIPGPAVDMTKAQRLAVSLYVVEDSTRPSTGVILQARIFVKTGAAWKWSTTEERDGYRGMTELYAGSWIDIDRTVGEFYTDSLPGFAAPTDLRAIGIQFFTWGGPWSGTVYIDELKLIDSTVAVSIGRKGIPVLSRGGRARGISSSVYAVDGRALELPGRSGTKTRMPWAGRRIYALPATSRE